MKISSSRRSYLHLIVLSNINNQCTITMRSNNHKAYFTFFTFSRDDTMVVSVCRIPYFVIFGYQCIDGHCWIKSFILSLVLLKWWPRGCLHEPSWKGLALSVGWLLPRFYMLKSSPTSKSMRQFASNLSFDKNL